MGLTRVNHYQVFAGTLSQYVHSSNLLNCQMRFSVFLPPGVTQHQSLPVVYWLSGLTSSDENFSQKAGAFRVAAELGLALVIPDTSPRGEGIPDDEGYDLGQGAGFYVNATEAPWSEHYQMYDYICEELPALVEAELPVGSKRAISGHSMGGHGALVIGLRNPERYRSISAFSPIANPCSCPWGNKALEAYLGGNKLNWLEYDACELLKMAPSPLPILVDQGEADDFLDEQLKPERLKAAAEHNNSPLELRMQAGYDHSYYFISSFIEDHLRFHASYLFD